MRRARGAGAATPAVHLVAALVALVGCTKASESTEAKRMPKPPPTVVADAGDALRIEITVDGVPGPALDAAKLAATPPDFHDDEHRAWKLATLLGPAAAGPRARITVSGAKGVSIAMGNPRGPEDPLPVLSMNRRGEAMAGLVPADQPFPAYHGQGGRLSRPGDPLPRIVGVTQIQVTTAD